MMNQLRLLLILVTCYIITNLRIATYNSRGHGVDRINYMYIRSLMLHNDVVLLQEHWYNDANINQLESLISGISVIGISGMKEDELLFGRPYGECAILYNNLVKCTVSPISYESKRCFEGYPAWRHDCSRSILQQCFEGFIYVVHLYVLCTIFSPSNGGGGGLKKINNQKGI